MSVDQLVEIVLDVDVDKEPACESRYHTIETWSHGGPATHWMLTPCGHPGLRCQPKVIEVQSSPSGIFHCIACRSVFPGDVISFIEL